MIEHATIPATLDTPDFREAWAEWLEHRQADLKRPMSERAERMALKRLAEMGPAAGIAAIEHSIAGGYRGIFPPPNTPREAPHSNPKSPIQNPKYKTMGAWETKERLRACENALQELVYPGGCATSATLTETEASEAARLRAEIRRLRANLTASR